MARYVRLDDRAVLAVSGGDASGFLQGLVTNDIGRLDGGAAIHAACSRRRASTCSTS